MFFVTQAAVLWTKIRLPAIYNIYTFCMRFKKRFRKNGFCDFRHGIRSVFYGTNPLRLPRCILPYGTLFGSKLSERLGHNLAAAFQALLGVNLAAGKTADGIYFGSNETCEVGSKFGSRVFAEFGTKLGSKKSRRRILKRRFPLKE